jgi:hypothetical protein
MSTEPSLQNTRIPSTPIPTIVNGTPSNPATSMVVVPVVPIITMAQPIVNAQATASNPFGCLGHSPSYNAQSIPMASSPFSYGMPNFTSQFSNSIPTAGPNASVGIGGSTPPYIPFSFGGSQIPQMTPNMGGILAFNTGSNPPTSGWNNQHDGQASTQVFSYNPTSLVHISTNTFGMTNPPLSSGFPPRGGQFCTLGNPQPGSNPAGGNFYNPQQNILIGIMPNQLYMNHPKGGPYNSRQGHGVYQKPGWPTNSQEQSFSGGWGHMSQPHLPFLATLNLLDLSKLMNDPVSHDPTCPPMPTKIPLDIPKFEGKNGEDPSDDITTFHLWCSSSFLNCNSIRLRLFQRTLIGVATKWYIELPRGAHGNFSHLVMVFLNHFQFPIRYDVGLELLSNLCQDTTTHISDHI